MKKGHQIFIYCLSIVLVYNDVLTEDGNSLTSECSQCRELVEKGVDYNNYDIGAYISNIQYWPECKERCTEEPTCKYWTHSRKLFRCWLKTTNEGRKYAPHSVTSGNRECGAVNISSATADFTQNNLCGFIASNLKGHRLQNGDFIFSWKSRKMVLTDNQGNVKKWGVVEYGAMSWQDPSTWIT